MSWDAEEWFKHHDTRLVRMGGIGVERMRFEEEEPENCGPNYEELDKLAPGVIRDICKDNLKLFSQYYFRHYMRFDDTGDYVKESEFHDWIYDLFTRETLRKGKGCMWAVAAPRGNAKSSITSLFFPIWCMVYDYKNFIIIISDTSGQAKDFLEEIKT